VNQAFEIEFGRTHASFWERRLPDGRQAVGSQRLPPEVQCKQALALLTVTDPKDPCFGHGQARVSFASALVHPMCAKKQALEAALLGCIGTGVSSGGHVGSIGDTGGTRGNGVCASTVHGYKKTGDRSVRLRSMVQASPG